MPCAASPLRHQDQECFGQVETDLRVWFSKSFGECFV